MDILLVLFICFAASYILGELFWKLKFPKVLGPIFVGLILSYEPIKLVMFPPYSATLNILSTFKGIAVIFLLFFVGLKIDLKEFIKSSKRSFSVASSAFLFPFVLGFIVTRLAGFDNLTALVVGACISVTAEAVAIEILEEMNLLKTRVGETIIEAGLIDDLFGILLIAGLATFITSESNPGYGLLKIVLEMAIFAVVIFFIRYYMVGRILHYVEKKKSKVDLFAASLILTLFLAAIATYLELGTVIGAVVAGMLVRHTLMSGPARERKEERDITEIIEITTFGFLAPFFFLWIGLATDFSILFINPVFVIVLTVIAVIGKVAGSVVGDCLSGGNMQEGLLIGWAMNTRGAVELIVASIALDYGLITVNLFSALVFMAFATTVISPVIFKFSVRRHHQEVGLR